MAMDPTERLAFTAQSKGASGVRAFLQDHRQQVPDVLGGLSESVLLGDAEPGIRMEQFSLRVQREIWSALASAASPAEDAALTLARAFLRVTAAPGRQECDGVCVSLAKMVVRAAARPQEESQVTPTDAAFRRRMGRMTLNRVVFPSPHDADEIDGQLNAQDAKASLKRLNSTGSSTRPAVIMKIEESSSEDSMNEDVTDDEMQERPSLTKQMEERASALSKQLVQLSRADASVAVDDTAARAFGMLAEIVSDVHTTYAANERSFQCLCQMLRMDSTSDDALFAITSSLVGSNWSSRYAAIFLETSVLPKIQAAESVISRVLLQTALCFGPSYAGTLLDSLLLPLLVGGSRNAAAAGPAQAEAITRILRSPDTVPADQLDEFIQKSLAAAVAPVGNDHDTRHLLSNDSALLVFQNILNAKPVLSSLTVERFVAACETVLELPEGEQLQSSLKFATVLFTLISKYPQQCIGHVETLESIATRLTSIMAKTTLRSLQKLKASK